MVRPTYSTYRGANLGLHALQLPSLSTLSELLCFYMNPMPYSSSSSSSLCACGANDASVRTRPKPKKSMRIESAKQQASQKVDPEKWRRGMPIEREEISWIERGNATDDGATPKRAREDSPDRNPGDGHPCDYVINQPGHSADPKTLHTSHTPLSSLLLLRPRSSSSTITTTAAFWKQASPSRSPTLHTIKRSHHPCPPKSNTKTMI